MNEIIMFLLSQMKYLRAAKQLLFRLPSFPVQTEWIDGIIHQCVLQFRAVGEFTRQGKGHRNYG